eukprot:8598076-Pyramimonas_sp.AAC.1
MGLLDGDKLEAAEEGAKVDLLAGAGLGVMVEERAGVPSTELNDHVLRRGRRETTEQTARSSTGPQDRKTGSGAACRCRRCRCRARCARCGPTRSSGPPRRLA